MHVEGFRKRRSVVRTGCGIGESICRVRGEAEGAPCIEHYSSWAQGRKIGRGGNRPIEEGSLALR